MSLWIGLACWALSALFVSVAAIVIHQPLRAHRPALDAVGYGFTWIFVTTLFTLLSGLAGLLRPLPLAAIALAGLGILALIPSSRRLMRGLPAGFSRSWHLLGDWWQELPVWLRWLTALLGIFSLIRFTFLIVVLPPFVWDSLTYHLTNVAHWTQAGKIELFDAPVVRIYTPANYEVLATWFTVFLHHDLVVEAAGLPAYGLAILAVYALARELGISRMGAWLASLSYGSMPALVLATTGTKNDPHMAAYFLTCLAIVAGILNRSPDDRRANPLGQAALLAVVLLFAFGTKAYMLHLSVAVLAFMLLGARGRGGFGAWRQRALAAWHAFLGWRTGGRLFLLGVFAAGLFLGGYWNVRNWVLTGNPFYPYGVQVGSTSVLPEADRTARLNLDRLQGNFESLLNKFGDSQQTVAPDLSNTTGWVWFVYGLGMITFLWGLVRRRNVRLLALCFGLGLVAIFLSDRPSPWNMRYVIWFPAVFSLAFAEWFDSIQGSSKGLVGWSAALLVFTIGLNYVMTLNYGVVRPGQFQQMLERSVWDRQSATLKINMPAEYENALVYVPKDALLGYNVGSNGFIYPLYRADFSQRIVYVPFEASDTCQAIVNEMMLKGTRYLFVAPEHTSDAKIAALQACSETPFSGLRQRARGLYVIKDGS